MNVAIEGRLSKKDNTIIWCKTLFQHYFVHHKFLMARPVVIRDFWWRTDSLMPEILKIMKTFPKKSKIFQEFFQWPPLIEWTLEFPAPQKKPEISLNIWATVRHSRRTVNYVVDLLVGVFIYARLKINMIVEVKIPRVRCRKFNFAFPAFLPDIERPDVLWQIHRNITNLNWRRSCS